MSDDVRSLIGEGRYGELFERCSDLLWRLDGESSEDRWRDSLREAIRYVLALRRVGELGTALKIVRLARVRFQAAPRDRDRDLGLLMALLLSLEAEIRRHQGEHAQALVAWDDGLSLLAGSSRMARRGAGLTFLLGKAHELTMLDRQEEAILVYDEVFTAVKAAEDEKDRPRAKSAATAAILKLANCMDLGRHEQVLAIGRELADAVGGLPADPLTDDRAPEVRSESALAAALAEIINEGECWDVFEGKRQLQPDEAAARAVRLYRLTDPWALDISDNDQGDEELPGTVDMVVGQVRDIADGYALVAGPLTQSQRLDPPLPKRGLPERDRLLKNSGIDTWAREHGYTLELRVDASSPDTPGASAPTQPRGWERVEESFVDGVIRTLVTIEIVSILTRSTGGRAALHDKLVSAQASGDVWLSRKWLHQLGAAGPDDPRVLIMFLCARFAQALFVASHDDSGQAILRLPSITEIREFLHKTGGYSWLISRNMPLPDWTHQPQGR